MVFHGDYEIEFEIYETRKNKGRDKLLGHMVGVDAYDAKTRWAEAHVLPDEKCAQIYALFPASEWK